MNGDKRAVIVTGSSIGIGAATAKLLAAQGHPVCVNYRSSEAAAREVVEAIVAAGGRAIAVGADVAREDDIVRLFESSDAELGPLGGLVNNAGITGPRCRVDEIDAATLDEVMRLNVTGAFLCVREAARRLSTRHGGKGGAIVNVSSRAAALGGPGEWVHYAASKGAVDSMTIGMSKELAAEGIRVNAVNPGLIDTAIHAKAGAGDRLATLGPSVPLGRIGTAEEVAETIAWLLSDAARYIVGALVPVSGGR